MCCCCCCCYALDNTRQQRQQQEPQWQLWPCMVIHQHWQKVSFSLFFIYLPGTTFACRPLSLSLSLSTHACHLTTSAVIDMLLSHSRAVLFFSAGIFFVVFILYFDLIVVFSATFLCAPKKKCFYKQLCCLVDLLLLPLKKTFRVAKQTFGFFSGIFCCSAITLFGAVRGRGQFRKRVFAAQVCKMIII